MKIQTYLARPYFTGPLWGIIGGLSLIIVTLSTTNGFVQLAPYPFILIAAILTIKFTDTSDKTFSRLFITGLLTFIIMTLFLYVYILTYLNPDSGITFLGHLWRMGAIIGFGIISSLILSIIAKPVNKHSK